MTSASFLDVAGHAAGLLLEFLVEPVSSPTTLTSFQYSLRSARTSARPLVRPASSRLDARKW